MSVDVAIIGGGISGLATAYYLKRAGFRVAVLERQARPGGNAISESIDGFLMEHGPSAIAENSAEALALSQTFGLDNARCDLGDAIRCRYLVKDDELSRIPLGPMGFLLSDYLSLPGRLRMMAEPLVRRCSADTPEETIAEFCRRRFGREFADRVIEPLVGGIYAGRSEALSLVDVFPKFADFERRFGSVTRGMIAGIRSGNCMPGSRLMSWRGGVGSLPKALAKDLRSEIRAGVTVRRIRRKNQCYQIDMGEQGEFSAAGVVVATQPHVAAGLLEKLDASAAAATGEIAAPPMAVVFLGYRRDQVDHPLDSLGFLAAASEGRSVNGVQFSSTMFPNRAPTGHVAVSAYVGGARQPELATRTVEELTALVRSELADLIGAHGQPVVARVRHWPRGIPQYGLGHAARVSAIEGLSERQPGLFVTGNFLVGPSVSACLSSAAGVASSVGGHFARCAAFRSAITIKGNGHTSSQRGGFPVQPRSIPVSRLE